MPIKWTPEIDQVLLLKILETSNVTADVKAISEAWPENMEKPTPRAITERLVKIRGSAKSAGATNHFSVTGKPTVAGSNTPRKPATTPRKRAPAGSAGVKKATPKKNGAKGNAAGKRKRSGAMSDDDDTEHSGFKSEDNDSSTFFDADESPSKKYKAKTDSRGNKTVVKVETDDSESKTANEDEGGEDGGSA